MAGDVHRDDRSVVLSHFWSNRLQSLAARVFAFKWLRYCLLPTRFWNGDKEKSTIDLRVDMAAARGLRGC
jgi:hypothetical protein